MTNDQTRQLKKIINHYGVKPQILKAVEELNECAAELMKFHFDKSSNEQEEIADAIIMLEQLRLIFNPEAIDEHIERKLARTIQRIEDDKNGGRLVGKK